MPTSHGRRLVIQQHHPERRPGAVHPALGGTQLAMADLGRRLIGEAPHGHQQQHLALRGRQARERVPECQHFEAMLLLGWHRGQMLEIVGRHLGGDMTPGRQAAVPVAQNRNSQPSMVSLIY